jgi:hypothetical protein
LRKRPRFVGSGCSAYEMRESTIMNGDLVETASQPLHVCGAYLQSVCGNDFIIMYS